MQIVSEESINAAVNAINEYRHQVDSLLTLVDQLEIQLITERKRNADLSELLDQARRKIDLYESDDLK